MRTCFTRSDHIISLIRMVAGKKMQMLAILVLTIGTASPNLVTELEAVRGDHHTAADHEDITDSTTYCSISTLNGASCSQIGPQHIAVLYFLGREI